MFTHASAPAALVVALVLYHVLRPSGKKGAIPWAKSAIPILGNALEWGADPLQFLLKQKRLVGEVFRVNLLLMKVTFVVGPRWNHWLLKEMPEEDASAYQTLPALSRGVISTASVQNGHPQLVSKHIRLGSNPPARQQDIAKLSMNLAQHTFEEWESRSELDLFAESSDLLLRVVFATCFGEQYAQSHELELFAITKGLQDGLTNPWSRLLPVWATACGRRLLQAKGSLQRMLVAEVQNRLKDLDSCREARDYLSFFLLSRSAKGDIETGDDLSTHFASYFVTAHANMAGIFGWAVLHLLRNPDTLSAFEAEISRNPCTEEGTYPLKSMPLGEACIRETGRLYGGVISLRYATRDLIGLDGIIVPKGFVAASPFAVHQDPELYAQPSKWNPSRFLPSADGTPSDYEKLLKNSGFHMFGSGKHPCPGEKMANTILRGSLWPSLLDNYRLEVIDGLISGEGVDGVGVKPAHGKTLGTPYAVRPVFVKLSKREIPLSAAIEA